MGKFVKKGKFTGDVSVMEVHRSALGVRTRARTLALQQNPEFRYLQLRSRRLEKPQFPPPSPPMNHEKTKHCSKLSNRCGSNRRTRPLLDRSRIAVRGRGRSKGKRRRMILGRWPPSGRIIWRLLEPEAYCVVAVESVGKQLPMAFLERVKEDFYKRYGGGKDATAPPKSLNKEFGPKLKEQMQYCVDHPEEMNKLGKVQAQISEVKGVMMENIEKAS